MYIQHALVIGQHCRTVIVQSGNSWTYILGIIVCTEMYMTEPILTKHGVIVFVMCIGIRI